LILRFGRGCKFVWVVGRHFLLPAFTLRLVFERVEPVLIADAGPSSFALQLGLSKLKFSTSAMAAPVRLAIPESSRPERAFRPAAIFDAFCERVLGVGPIDEIWYFVYQPKGRRG
jgi:hypothetical protein